MYELQLALRRSIGPSLDAGRCAPGALFGSATSRCGPRLCGHCLRWRGACAAGAEPTVLRDSSATTGAFECLSNRPLHVILLPTLRPPVRQIARTDGPL